MLLLDDVEADQAEVALVVGDSVNEPTLRTLRALRRQKAVPALALVVTHRCHAVAYALRNGLIWHQHDPAADLRAATCLPLLSRTPACVGLVYEPAPET
ncbi:hypothetical protein ACIBPB_02810 [Micromonospora sp. NPDC049836]|uniref:hypothetical protein n=1 Tax=Micromonospora sp. NPDC049836 TaxID=3364274 RepID=UPI0037999C69